jgi:p-aminobenzoyl-glutamate transporter AbgT
MSNEALQNELSEAELKKIEACERFINGCLFIILLVISATASNLLASINYQLNDKEVVDQILQGRKEVSVLLKDPISLHTYFTYSHRFITTTLCSLVSSGAGYIGIKLISKPLKESLKSKDHGDKNRL